MNTESSTRRRIRAAAKKRGYAIKVLRWSPIRHIDMDVDGGWWVSFIPFHDIIVNSNAQCLIAEIKKMERPLGTPE